MMDKLPREILRIVCEIVAEADLQAFCRLFCLSKRWGELNQDITLWASVARVNGVAFNYSTIAAIKVIDRLSCLI